MSETIVAGTNWIEIAKVSVSLVAPIVALAGAVYLYFRKLADDRVEALRFKRLELYSDYLSAYADAVGKDDGTDYEPRSWHIVNAIRPYHERMVVTAPVSVVEASWSLIKTFLNPITARKLSGDTVLPSAAEFIEEVGRQTAARRLLAEEMRGDALGKVRVTATLPPDKMLF